MHLHERDSDNAPPARAPTSKTFNFCFRFFFISSHLLNGLVFVFVVVIVFCTANAPASKTFKTSFLDLLCLGPASKTSRSLLYSSLSRELILTFSTLLPIQLLQETQWKLASRLARSCRAIAINSAQIAVNFAVQFPVTLLSHLPYRRANPPCKRHSCSQRSTGQQASVGDSLCFPRDSAARSCRKLSHLGILSSGLATLHWCPHSIWGTLDVSLAQ